jgi:hypothetical protein
MNQTTPRHNRPIASVTNDTAVSIDSIGSNTNSTTCPIQLVSHAPPHQQLGAIPTAVRSVEGDEVGLRINWVTSLRIGWVK